MFVMTKYSHHSTAGFGEQVGKKKERFSGLKMLSQSIFTYFYWDFIGFLPCNVLGGTHWCDSQVALQGFMHIKFPFHRCFLPALYVYSWYGQNKAMCTM